METTMAPMEEPRPSGVVLVDSGTERHDATEDACAITRRTAADERLSDAEREELAEVAALVEAATEGARQAATALHEARGAYRHVWGRIARRHAVTDRDGIDTATGAIARNRAPAPGPRG